jgi:hypothetical protein
MLDAFVNRLLNWSSLTLLVVVAISFFSVVNLMRQTIRTLDRADWSVLELAAYTFQKAPEGNWNVLVLIASSVWLYSRLVGLSRYDWNLTSLSLAFVGSALMFFILVCAAAFTKWTASNQME